MLSIEFDVPGEPTGKGRPRISTRGGFARTYTPAKTSEYEAVVRSAALQAMSGQNCVSGAVRVVLEAYKVIPASWSRAKKAAALDGSAFWGKPDLDNICKAVLDGMSKTVFDDDAQVTILHCSKHWSTGDGFVRVRVSEVIG